MCRYECCAGGSVGVGICVGLNVVEKVPHSKFHFWYKRPALHAHGLRLQVELVVMAVR